MRVLGIDCGTEFTGYGVVDLEDGQATAAYGAELRAGLWGAVRLNKKEPMAVRLLQVFRELTAVMEAHRPDVVAIEEVFYSANAKSALKLGQVRGVALLAAASCGIEIAEYAPLRIKQAVTGYGLAQKEQVGFMAARLLRMEAAPEPADAADALAIAICHLHTAQTLVNTLRPCAGGETRLRRKTNSKTLV